MYCQLTKEQLELVKALRTEVWIRDMKGRILQQLLLTSVPRVGEIWYIEGDQYRVEIVKYFTTRYNQTPPLNSPPSLVAEVYVSTM